MHSFTVSRILLHPSSSVSFCAIFLIRFTCPPLYKDVDHLGVSNAQLVKEGHHLAAKYVRSVAEQNSLDLTWELLMGSEFKQLREFLLPTKTEMQRFRQLVVNVRKLFACFSVLALIVRNGTLARVFLLCWTYH